LAIPIDNIKKLFAEVVMSSLFMATFCFLLFGIQTAFTLELPHKKQINFIINEIFNTKYFTSEMVELSINNIQTLEKRKLSNTEKHKLRLKTIKNFSKIRNNTKILYTKLDKEKIDLIHLKFLEHNNILGKFNCMILIIENGILIDIVTHFLNKYPTTIPELKASKIEETYLDLMGLSFEDHYYSSYAEQINDLLATYYPFRQVHITTEMVSEYVRYFYLSRLISFLSDKTLEEKEKLLLAIWEIKTINTKVVNH
jgi:hypothetical protein